MNEQPDIAADEERKESRAGKRLAEARQARDITIVDIAQELHLDEPKVRALEQNRFDALGAPVFVKGYIRKYAELVGVPVDEVLAEYRRFEERDEPPPIVGLRRPPGPEVSVGPWLRGILVIAIVAGAAWLWLSGTLDPLFSSPEPATPAPFAPAAQPSGDAVVQPEPETEIETEPAAAEPVLETEAQPVLAEPLDAAEVLAGETGTAASEAPPAGPPGEGEVRLSLAFTGDCWTEVSDAAGTRLYFGLGKAGDTASVVGAAPLHVLLGDSKNATVRVDGEAFPIPPGARRGDTARLTITAR